MSGSYYEGFGWGITEIVKFIEAAGIFTMLLTTRKVVHFTPENAERFRRWLKYHNITDIT
ncbi:hypothetical protein F3J22_19340 [Chitinophaga sp. Cy-1792]|nr:hypothetical protein [Chitinophaga sp. Cy-1792]